MQYLEVSYLVALVSIFGICTVLYTNANSPVTNNRTVGKNPKETPIPNIDASVLIDGGNDENQIEIGKRLKVLVSINFPDTEETAISIIDKFTVSLIDEKNPDEPIYSEDLDTKCGISFKKDNLVVPLLEECDFTYKINKQDVDKTVKAKVDFLNSEGEVISTIYSATGKTVIAAENKLSNTGITVSAVIGTIAIMICVYATGYSNYKWLKIISSLIAISIGIFLASFFIYNKSPKDIVVNSIFSIIGTPIVAFLSG